MIVECLNIDCWIDDLSMPWTHKENEIAISTKKAINEEGS